MNNNIKVLIVDAEDSDLLNLQALIEGNMSAQVIKAKSGEEALIILMENSVDLIILDVNLDGINGFETAEILKRRKLTKDVPIIFLFSDSDSDELKKLSFKLGAIDYITKPIDEFLLLNRINIYLEVINKERNMNKELEERLLKLKEDFYQNEKESKALMQNIFSSLKEGILILDINKRIILDTNTVAEELSGYERHEIVGRYASMFHINEREYRNYLEEKCRSIAEKGYYLGELFMKRKDGSIYQVEAYVRPLMDDKGITTKEISVIRDITELKKKEEELVLAKENADIANKAKSMFLANMSHEIRTPMNGILGMAALLGMTELNQEQTSYLNMIRISGQKLLEIINNLLDLSKIEAQKAKVNKDKFNFNKSMEAAINMHNILAEQKEIEFNYSIEDSIPEELIGDEIKLIRVINNLCGNAIKFTERGFVKLKIVKLKETSEKIILRFVIKDSGIGMSAETKAKLFNNFTQGDESYTKKYEGTGLGLVLSKKLVEIMGGELSYYSSLGIGSEFSFEIEFEKVNESSNYIQENNDEDIDLSEIFKHKKILLVEDNKVSRIFVQKLMSLHKVKIETASDGKEAIEKYKEANYDIILMDVQMPIMNGFEATKIIKALDKENNKHTIIIALTAYAMEGDREKCLNAGMDDYIAKPIDIKSFMDIIKKHIKIN